MAENKNIDKKPENNQQTQIDQLNYTGSVTVRVMKKRKETARFQKHNIGLGNLFKGFCYYLVGSFDKTYIPQRLTAYYTTAEGKEEIALSNASVISSKRVVSDSNDTNYTAIFTAVITYNQLKDKTLTITKLVMLGSGNDQTSNPLAEIAVGGKEFDWDGRIAEKSSIIIEWKMQITSPKPEEVSNK